MTWKQEARRIENEPRVDVSCRPNDPCSGLDCTGLYSYNVRVFFVKIMLVNLNFYFALLFYALLRSLFIIFYLKVVKLKIFTTLTKKLVPENI